MSMFGLKPREAPLVDAKLPERLHPVYTATWIELVARCKLPAPRKSVATMLASFADADGTNAFPSLDKLAVMAGLTPNNARTHLQKLVALGLLFVVRPGGGRSNPTVYRLVCPDLTALPLVLDPDMEPIPDGAGYTLIAAETLPAAGGYPVETLTESGVFPGAETLTGSGGYRPVDNSAPTENPPESAPKPPRSSTETLPAAGPDLTTTYPEPENLLGSSRVSTSPDWRERGPAPAALAVLVGPPTPDLWTPLGAEAAVPPAPVTAEPPTGPRTYAAPQRVVTASATLASTPAAAALFALLDAQPGGGEWYFAGAARELRREGIPDPTRLDLAVRAAAILRRTDLERSA